MYDPESIPPWHNFADDLAGKPAIQHGIREYWGVQDFGWREWSSLLAMCYGYVILIDEQVGRLLQALEEQGLAQFTAVIFTADHGGMLGAHGLADKGPYLYDEICRVPLIVRMPGIQTSRTTYMIVSIIVSGRRIKALWVP
ncbi:MAG: sulfatase-like hydrolase/transferase, partial [Kiritimatiellia bacterium]